MFSGVPLTLQSVSLLASALRTNLDFQPNAGSVAERGQWFRTLDESLKLASTPAGRVARFFGQDDWNLKRARSLLENVRSQATLAGLLIADPGAGFAANVSRFGSDTPKAALYVIQNGTVREESRHDCAQRLVRALFESPSSAHDTLVRMLDRSFEAHIRRLERQADSLETVAMTRCVPENAAYPRDFQDAHPPLMDYLRRTLIEISGEGDIPWWHCARETVGLLIERLMEKEGIDAATASTEESKRGLAIAMQIPDYSAFQLLCLLIQIGCNEVDEALVAQLKKASNGRVLALGIATPAEVRWRDLLKASELTGNIDIIHANIGVAYELALQEQPDTDPAIVSLQVRAAVSRLGKATGSSRAEYDDAIARLKALESDPQAGRVIHLKGRNH